ncbi:hypothetical protein JCM6882_004643 [Rhodosporidiobolus microsporus]
MSSGEGVASSGPSSSAALDALLEESSRLDEDQLAALGAEPEDTEPIPTLASLLLSTAESLAARSTTTPSSSASKPPAKAAQPAFALASSPQTLLNNPATPNYLSSLLAQPLTALQTLPTSLSNLSTSLDNDLSSLAFTRYSSFLLSYTAAQSISTSFTTLSDSLAALLDSTSALEAAASSFEARVHTVREKRERFARVRERIEEVEELLEAPSVVDACVRAGFWSEAIDVAVRLEELHKRLSSAASSYTGEGRGALSLLNAVRAEVGVALLSLRARVLESLLQRTLKLPGAVRGIGILRRIAERAAGTGKKELDEEGLRLVFLTARWRCLRTELETVEAQMAASGVQLSGGGHPAVPYLETSIEENEERTRWTKRWIESWREVVGETVGMYTEVFLSSSSLAASSLPPLSSDLTDFALPSPSADPTAPLHLFLSTALTSLSDILTKALPSINSPSSLSSLLTQLTYCSHSFARHGLDFREVLNLRERVELRLGHIIAADFELAGRKWEKEWRSGWENSGGTGTTAAKARRSGRIPIVDWLVMPEGLSTLLSTPLPDEPASTSTASPTWSHQPSPSLALLPPLARFLNAHATALNSLRLLPPLALFQPLRRAQAAELDRATQVLAAFTDAWLAALNATPLLAQNGFTASSPSFSTAGGEDALSEDEKLLLRERDEERRAVAAAVAWFGRVVLPWCEGALERGVYAEVLESDRAPDAAGKRETAVRDAVRRCERLVARIEGREWVDPEEEQALPVGAEEVPPAEAQANDEAPASSANKAAKEAAPADLPVLDAPAVALDPPSVAAVAASLPEANGAPHDGIPTTAAPVDFSLPPVEPPSSSPVPPAAAKDENAPDGVDGDEDAPYLVNDTAPIPPVAPDASTVVDAKEIEQAGVVVNGEGDEEEGDDEDGWGLGTSEVVEEEEDEGNQEA